MHAIAISGSCDAPSSLLLFKADDSRAVRGPVVLPVAGDPTRIPLPRKSSLSIRLHQGKRYPMAYDAPSEFTGAAGASIHSFVKTSEPAHRIDTRLIRKNGKMSDPNNTGSPVSHPPQYASRRRRRWLTYIGTTSYRRHVIPFVLSTSLSLSLSLNSRRYLAQLPPS